ncbi:MAG: short-chain fatty acid transporter [Proteobacteria bacterium]|jgi:short-chain fatty acids transporter|nr:short-chain fatty acid transporter [Pseudomonadota bacterium]MBT6464476.1 short-chain fatty acid transporter [Pseudomonadota bacterium]MBT7247367.1 short-chain fatty acid transporter [Pseudomonadota bacterium]MBT7561216.1 short-chain fatty acid transporter [Pseudomonadota bacterium]
MIQQFRRFGAGLSDVTERWVPDAWVISMMLTAVASLLCIFGAGATVEETVLAWGDGVWSLLGLAMQFTIAMVAAHACAASPPIYRFFNWLASLPNPSKPVQALVLAGMFSLVMGYLNWAVCLVSCALFTPFILRRNPNVDVRLLICASYLGIGTVWHGGLSGSAPLILATPGNPLINPSSGAPIVDRLYPVTETLYNNFNLVFICILGAVALATTCLLHPRSGARTLSAEEIEKILPTPPKEDGPPRTPAEYIDQFRGWVLLAVVLLAYPLGYSIVTKGFGTSWTINAYNITFLVIALLLHGRAPSFLRACRNGVDSAWGIVVQFPFYAGIFGLMQNTDLGEWLGSFFSNIATTATYPWVVYVYSGLMNLFVPSAGSKWMIEAPFLIPAGELLNVSVVTTTLAYAYGDSVTNLIQPFFAIPILAVTRMRFGDVVGYTFLVAVVCFMVTSVAMFMIPPQW